MELSVGGVTLRQRGPDEAISRREAMAIIGENGNRFDRLVADGILKPVATITGDRHTYRAFRFGDVITIALERLTDAEQLMRERRRRLEAILPPRS